jgi:hypothetical protein
VLPLAAGPPDCDPAVCEAAGARPEVGSHETGWRHQRSAVLRRSNMIHRVPVKYAAALLASPVDRRRGACGRTRARARAWRQRRRVPTCAAAEEVAWGGGPRRRVELQARHRALPRVHEEPQVAAALQKTGWGRVCKLDWLWEGPNRERLGVCWGRGGQRERGELRSGRACLLRVEVGPGRALKRAELPSCGRLGDWAWLDGCRLQIGRVALSDSDAFALPTNLDRAVQRWHSTTASNASSAPTFTSYRCSWSSEPPDTTYAPAASTHRTGPWCEACVNARASCAPPACALQGGCVGGGVSDSKLLLAHCRFAATAAAAAHTRAGGGSRRQPNHARSPRGHPARRIPVESARTCPLRGA